MKKKTLLIILLCIFIPVALAATGAGDGESGGNDFDTEYKGDLNNNWHTIPGTSKVAKGVRVSFVTSDGYNVGSKDYLLENDYYDYFIKTPEKYKVNSPLSKVGYFYNNNKLKIDWTKTTNLSDFSTLSNLEAKLNVTVEKNGAEYSFNFGKNIYANINSYSFDEVINNIVYKLSSAQYSQEVNNALATELFESLLDEIGINEDLDYFEYNNKEGIYDLFLVFEPITVFKIQGELYLGTIYELVTKTNKYKVNGNSLTDERFNNPVRNFSCAAYLSGDLGTEMTNVASGIDDLTDKFNNGKYFNGIINVSKSEDIGGYCRQENWTKEQYELVYGDYGIGMGVVWISQVFDGDGDGDGDGGGDPEPEGYNCSPNLSYGTCINGNNVSYSDPPSGSIESVSDEYWDNCVFDDNGKYNSYFSDIHKWSDEDKDLTYYEKNLGSDYCPVYCIEEVTAQFTTPNIEVEAGSKFTLGTSTVKGSRTCKTKEIYWSKFEEDLDKYEVQSETAYDNYAIAWKNYTDAQDNLHAAYTTASQIEDGSINTFSSFSLTYFPECCNTESGDVEENNTCSDDKATCETLKNKICYYKYQNYTNILEVEPNVVCPVGNKHIANAVRSAADSALSTAEANLNTAKTNLEAVKNLIEGAISAMNSCYDWVEENIYNVDPQATLTYSDGVKDGYGFEQKLLNSSTSYHETTKVLNSVGEIDLEYTLCDENGCEEKSYKSEKYDSVTMTRSAETTFSLPEDTYRYVLKSNHESVHSIKGNPDNYIDIGYGNLPVSFSAPAGTYGGENNPGQLDITYSKLGHITNGIIGYETAVDKIMDNDNIPESDSYGQWICQYEVITNLLPEDPGTNLGGDINLIYRPIDLSNPFPGINGTGRETGSNWCDGDNCSNLEDNDVVNNFILNNRDEDTDDVYNIEPMYSFTLTPSIIREIRNYNKENTYTSYTGKLNSNTYDYVCNKNDIDNTGKACVSGYLTYLIGEYPEKISGTCMDNKYRNPENPEDFYSCQ